MTATSAKERTRFAGYSESLEKLLETTRAEIDVWGVGTRLVTGHDDPALGGVYKLSAIRKPGEPWRYPIKLSEQTSKISTPGLLAVRRFHSGQEFLGDLIYDEEWGVETPPVLVDPADMTRRKAMAPDTPHTDHADASHVDTAHVDTPHTQIDIVRPGLYRIDVDSAAERTVVSVRATQSPRRSRLPAARSRPPRSTRSTRRP